MPFMTKDHADNLPTVRIQKMILENFKSVRHGELVFNCGKEFVPYGTKSDIMGIYGQNGSGKTAIIEALAILRILMSGGKLPSVYAECIARNADYSRLTFTFDLQYPDGRIRKVEYSFCISAEQVKQNETVKYESTDDDDDDDEPISNGMAIHVFNEILRVAGDIDGEKKTMKPFIDTSRADMPFSSKQKMEQIIGTDKKLPVQLEVNKQLAYERSRSFVFMKDTVKLISSTGLYSEYYQLILELHYFSVFYFFVVNTKSSGLIRLNVGMPLYTRNGTLPLNAKGPTTIPTELFNEINEQFENINSVLTQLVPELSIGLKSLSPTLMKDGKEGRIVEMVASRDGVELPLRSESDGIRKIISILALIIAVYNDQSCTVAIDEFDAGIFEYLLGEILQTIEESGKGQFIFTSHNLRPLEVIDKKYLYFTTTNPDNRYIHLKSIGKTNNLRNVYFREILMHEQDEEIYNRTKRYKIVDALRKAGVGNGKEA